MTKVRIEYKDKRAEELYLKMIQKGKIKESVFCYGSLLYQKYLKNEGIFTISIVQKKISTIQETLDDCISSIILSFKETKNNYAEVNLINLKKFCEKNFNKERWIDSLDIKDKDIIFIAKNMNIR